MANNTLRSAKSVKNDEFYTQLVDIENELKHYKNQFRGKTVFCNCDDPFESNFFKYFASNFNYLGLKKLIATSFTQSPIAGTQLALLNIEGLKPDTRRPFKIEINEVPDTNGDGAVNISDVEYLLEHDKNVATPLKGNGDFRSEECIELLKQSDIVVTNPPFSLFREYLELLVEYDKQFLIIGNKNSITYREVFKLIKENKMWLGYRNINSDMWLEVPEGHKYEKIVNGKKLKHIMACWLTNLETTKRHELFDMYRKYNPGEYPEYHNYKAINVNIVADIPGDYDGAMGVPITFLDKYNPEQFEIIGLGISNSGIEVGVKPYTPEHKKYRKEIQKRGAVNGDLYMVQDGIVTVPYARVLIKKRSMN
jgi:hypothetical protein